MSKPWSSSKDTWTIGRRIALAMLLVVELNGPSNLITLKHPSTPPPTPSTNDPQKMTGNLQNSVFNELSDIEDQSEEASDSALQEES